MLPFVFFRMHWDQEPTGFPLTRLRGRSRFGAAKARPTDTLSPTGGYAFTVGPAHASRTVFSVFSRRLNAPVDLMLND